MKPTKKSGCLPDIWRNFIKILSCLHLVPIQGYVYVLGRVGFVANIYSGIVWGIKEQIGLMFGESLQDIEGDLKLKALTPCSYHDLFCVAWSHRTVLSGTGLGKGCWGKWRHLHFCVIGAFKFWTLTFYPRSLRSESEGRGTPLQPAPCLENPMERSPGRAAVQQVAAEEDWTATGWLPPTLLRRGKIAAENHDVTWKSPGQGCLEWAFVLWSRCGSGTWLKWLSGSSRKKLFSCKCPRFIRGFSKYASISA